MAQLAEWEKCPINGSSGFKTAVISCLDMLKRKDAQLNFKDK
jgi:hypothetical protein